MDCKHERILLVELTTRKNYVKCLNCNKEFYINHSNDTVNKAEFIHGVHKHYSVINYFPNGEDTVFGESIFIKHDPKTEDDYGNEV